MARKLNSEEEQLFVEALRKDTANDSASEQYVNFARKRDTPLQLSRELAAWLSEDPLGPIIS